MAWSGDNDALGSRNRNFKMNWPEYELAITSNVCYSVLHCSVLRCVAVCCGVLRCVAGIGIEICIGYHLKCVLQRVTA